nr:RNA-dependent RNA polymerase [Flumine noda-like virus 19]
MLRELERIVLVRAFDAVYTPELHELHSSQFNQSAVGSFGSRYNTGTARASGSPETSAFNSLANAFVAFLTFRSMKVNDGYFTAEEAWGQLGIYGGDDGLTADVCAKTYASVASQLGMKLDVQQVSRGELGVSFLARTYGPDVWHGDNNSCCDLPRQISKIHVTVSLPQHVTPMAKLLEKARAYALSDINTPILGDFVGKIIGLAGIDTVMSTTIHQHIWNSDHQHEDQYPNQDAGWMTDYATQSLAPYEFSWTIFHDWLAGVKRCEDMLSPPLCCQPKQPAVEMEVIVDGDVLLPDRPKAPRKAHKGPKAVRSTRGRSRRPRKDGNHGAVPPRG